jgi:tetratricopeptide (TPR) repeat protein
MLRSYVNEQVQWVQGAPRDPHRHETLGLVYAANGLWPEAKLAFENAVRLDPNEPLAWLYLAVSEQELGRLDRAIALLRDVTARFPTFAPGFYRLGDYSLRTGTLDQAERAFTQLIGLAPGEWRGFAGLGEVQLRKGDLPGAARLLEKAVEIDASAKPAHALLGQAYQRLGRTADARREGALGMNAAHFPMPDAWSMEAPRHMRLPFDILEIAQEQMKNGAPAKAVQVLENAVPFHSNDPNLLVTLSLAYTMAGQPERARSVLNHVLPLNSNLVPAYVALSGAELALGHPDQALSNANKAVLLSTNAAEPYLAEANALLAMERDTEAVAALEAAHRFDSNNAQILLDLGDIRLRNLDQPEQALEDYQLAVKKDPVLLGARLRLAGVYLKTGDKQRAIETLEAARQLAPTDAGIAAALARVKSPPGP